MSTVAILKHKSFLVAFVMVRCIFGKRCIYEYVDVRTQMYQSIHGSSVEGNGFGYVTLYA
jgi:hypothetical protein